MFRSALLSSSTLLVLTSTFAVGQAARADDAPAQPETAATLQEVVVTAQKRQEKLINVPMAVTAITSDSIKSMHLIDFADLETQVPGLSVELEAPGLDKLTLRGENVGGVGSTVTTYIDDVPFGSSNALANGSIAAGDFDTWDLQRVEVLRGPQGTLYGAGSEGGLLKYVTNPPDPTHFSSEFELGDEDVAHGQNALSYKAMVNLPVTGSAALRLDGFYTKIPGYIDDPQLGASDVNRGYQEGGRASFLVNVTGKFSIRLTAFGQTLHTDGSPEIDVIGAPTPAAPPANQLQPDDGNYDEHRFIGEPSTFKYDVYSATLNWDLGWATLTSITSDGTTTEDQLFDGTSADFAPGFTGADLVESLLAPGTDAGAAETDDLYIKKFTQEVRLVSPSAQTLEWQLGAFYTREASTLAETIPSFIIPTLASTGLPSLENVNLDALYREWSGFGQITYHFNPAFDLALGGRWSENKQSASELIAGLLVNPPELSGGGSTGTDFTYSVAPRWHLSQDTMAYVRVASGYRPGGPNALPPLTTGVPATYQADSTVNYELGLKTVQLDNRLSIDVDAFLINWKKIQLFEFIQEFGINANGGTATSKGLEWSFALTPVEGLNLTLSGAYVDAYLTSDAPATGGVTGDHLPYAPKFSNSLDADYTWRAFGDYSAFAGATWSYIGSRFVDFSATNTGIQGNNLIFEPNPRAELGGYNTLNLRVGLQNDRWTLELYCKNIADTRGLTFYTNTGTPNSGGAVVIQQPRTIGATLDLHF
jgi:outer membrane receptor protein involved in Fe transport